MKFVKKLLLHVYTNLTSSFTQPYIMSEPTVTVTCLVINQ